MMNYIWVGLVVIAVIFGAITGNLSAVQGAIFDFAMTAVEIVFELIGILCFFSGLMAVAVIVGVIVYLCVDADKKLKAEKALKK